MKGRYRRGFTLLEIVFALSLIGLVLVAMNTFLFSMGELWGRRSEQRLFDLHVRGVTRVLTRELAHAASPQRHLAQGPAYQVRELRLQDGRTEAVLTFTLPEESRLLNWPEERALPGVETGLVWREGRGLFLVWRSRLEERFGETPPRETLLTPWVTGLAYDYYDRDFENWKTETQLRRDPRRRGDVPGRLRLTFTYQGRRSEVLLPLPQPVEGVARP